ncbi:BTAD domain-containing putative transcriptional regulator [Streptomyces sp. NPDC052016]|uniref:BTAD domain-containing putative transcriptional regulator n=1 Tax=Streptomyces sp. NPDC052016 TaxID=3365680 RepID=UPI0037D804AF
MEQITFGVLGPVVAWDAAGGVLGLKGPRHRAVLARLITARRRVVPVARLVEDLWGEPAPGAVGSVQTFVAALRRVLEPDRPARTPARLLVTEGPGYALRAAPEAVDAWRFEAAVGAAAKLSPAKALETLEEALELWRGPAYADFAQEDWARGERSRLAELRLRAVEQQARARLALGLAAEAVPELDAHLAEHPWREEAWRLLALALYRTGRQADALAVLRRARAMLADELGVDPGPELRRLETDVLAQDPRLDLPAEPMTSTEKLWTRAAADYDRTVAAGARARLESTVGLIRDLAVTGGAGLRAAQEHRLAAITAAEELGDPELTARVIGAYDVPAIWTRNDDPHKARQIVAAAEHTLAALPTGGSHEAARCRLLATIALEMRGTRSTRGPRAAREAEEIARRLDDPALMAFALNGAFIQSCTRAGLAPRRDAIGAELVTLAARHGLVTFEVLGHLIRMQAQSALGDFTAADEHAAAADHLAERNERPLASVFTQWYRALRLAASGQIPQAEAAYRAAAARLDGAGMPGVEHGLLSLAQLCLRLADGNTSAAEAAEHVDAGADWGPYRPWAELFVLLRTGRRADTQAMLRALPEPPADLMYEALCCLQAAVALELGARVALEQLHARLLPAACELAGAGSGLVTLGPVDRWLTDITDALGRRSG